MAQTHDLFLQRISLCDIQVSEIKTNSAIKVNWGIKITLNFYQTVLLNLKINVIIASTNGPLSLMAAYFVIPLYSCYNVNYTQWPHFGSNVVLKFVHVSEIRKAY